MVFGWLPWFFKVVSWFLVGSHGFSRWFHGFSWFLIGFHGSSRLFHGLSWFLVGFYSFSMWFLDFSWSLVGFHGFSRWFHGLSWFLVGFHGFVSWEHHKTVSWPNDPVEALPAVGRLWPSDDNDNDDYWWSGPLPLAGPEELLWFVPFVDQSLRWTSHVWLQS